MRFSIQWRFPHRVVLFTPYLIYGLGIALNVIAITANHGFMPVVYSAIFRSDMIIFPGMRIDEIHRVMQSTDHLKILCDWIQLPRTAVCSPGDVCEWLGDWLMGPAFIAWLTLLWKDANENR